ncbi:MAG: DNA recombination protein RmuC [Paracoccaceae bacterium]
MAGLEWPADLNDPVLLVLFAGAVTVLLLFSLLIWAIRAARRSAAAAEPLGHGLLALSDAVRGIDQGQHQLAGGLKLVTEQQINSQTRIMDSVERRLEDVQKSMGESLYGTATRTARSLGELQQRLEAIDKAQTKIEKLSGEVIGLQDILSNKQARGAFGEIQLNDIIQKALPPDAYTLQATLSNGKRADSLIHLPNPPGPIAVDAKFPLEPYEALVAADTEQARKAAAQQFRRIVLLHVKAIAERYILEGETADCAMMFLPSEAVYAELHSNFSEVVQEGFQSRVFIVSPTTMMATLNTIRAILKDARMREQAGNIRRELSLLHKDMERLGERVGNLDRHFSQASKDIDEIRISAGKAGNRARKLEAFEFEEAEPTEPPRPKLVSEQS